MEGETMEQIAEREPLIRRAMTVEDIFSKNAEERRLYELREKGRRIYESAIRKAERDGEARTKRQIARSMLTSGIPADTIAKITGLSIEEINSRP
jgi:predicted transposase/invertase (TIGR01784 family)